MTAASATPRRPEDAKCGVRPDPETAPGQLGGNPKRKSMRNMILAAALFALCSPAWAGGSHNGGTAVGGTSASSASGFQAGGEGRSSASGTFSNTSHASNKGGESSTSSKSRGAGESTKGGGWYGYSEGATNAFTLVGFGHH